MPIIILPGQSGSSGGSGQNVWNPSMGPGMLPGFDEGGGSTSHPVYSVGWDSLATFLTDTDIEIRFVVSRLDGELCDAPTSATATVTIPDGTSYDGAQTIEGGGQAAEQIVSSAYRAVDAGTYRIAVRITMPDGTKIGASQKVYVW